VLVLPCLVFLGTFGMLSLSSYALNIILPLGISIPTAPIVLTLLVNFCAGNSDADLELGAFTHPPFCLNIQILSYSFQLCTAIVATSLIGAKTWCVLWID
jgi:hypothetical protein